MIITFLAIVPRVNLVNFTKCIKCILDCISISIGDIQKQNRLAFKQSPCIYVCQEMGLGPKQNSTIQCGSSPSIEYINKLINCVSKGQQYHSVQAQNVFTVLFFFLFCCQKDSKTDMNTIFS